jgi:hypothetical protein
MYEGQWQVNSEAANAYISPALASTSITPILVTWLQACIDAGFTFPLNWWQIGCSQAASGNTPEDELSNNWSALVTTGSPQLSAIQTIAAGTYTPQRNIVAAVGTTTISLFADQLSAAPVSLTSDVNFLFSFGCAPAQVQFPVAATKQLSINVTGSGTVSVIIDNAIVATGVSVSTGTIVIGTYAFSASQHSIAVGSNSYQNVSVNDLVFS